MTKGTSALHEGRLLASRLLVVCGVVVGCGPGSPAAPTQPQPKNPAPTIVSVNPSIGSTGGGASITITGIGLLPGIRVAFGAATVAASLGQDPDRIHVITPRHPAGSVDLVVTNVDGQNAVSRGAYTFAAPESFDVNGDWQGASFAGDDDEPFTFTVVNSAVVSITCATSGLVKLLPPAPIILGEFFFRGEDGVAISGRILALNEATGVISIARGAKVGPCVGAEWHAARE